MSNSLFVALLAMIASGFRTRAALQAEILALRHQLAVLQTNAPRHLRLKRSDRVLWLLLSRFWSGWPPCLKIVQPATVIAWQRRAFAWHWTRKIAAVVRQIVVHHFQRISFSLARIDESACNPKPKNLAKEKEMWCTTIWRTTGQ